MPEQDASGAAAAPVRAKRGPVRAILTVFATRTGDVLVRAARGLARRPAMRRPMLRGCAGIGRSGWAAPVLLGVTITTGTARAGPPSCVRQIAGSAPLRIDNGFISMSVLIEGRAASLLVDTGAERGLVTPAAMFGLGLPPDPAHRSQLRGTGGPGRTVHNALLPPMAVDGTELPGGSVPVAALPSMPMISPAVAGLVGVDTLSRFDVEFDLGRHRITFWRVRLGSVACAPPPAWDGTFDTMPMRLDGGRPVLDATLDGHRVTALLDSGARSRIVSLRAASRIGVATDVLGGDPGGITAGIDGRENPYHWHRFAELSVGRERFAHPVLTVAPVAERFDLLLGSDWFADRDVWVSYATGMVFVRP